jgi:hypothetical protein
MHKEVILIDKGRFHGVVIGFLNGKASQKKQIEGIKKAASSLLKKGCYHFKIYSDKSALKELECWSDYLFSVDYDEELKKFSKSWTVKYYAIDQIVEMSDIGKDLNELEKDEKKEEARKRIASKWGNQPITSEEIKKWREEHKNGMNITQIAKTYFRRYATVWSYVKGFNREKV